MIDKRLKYKRGGAAQDSGNEENQAASAAAASSSSSSSSGGDGRPNMADVAGPSTTTSFTADDDNREQHLTNQYKDLPTPTVTVAVDKFDNPIEIETTYTDKRNRQNVLDALNAKGISSFDPRVQRYGITPFGFFAPPEKKKGGFWSGLGTIVKNIALGVVAPQLLVGTKFGTVYNAYNTIDRINNLVNTLGITDINVIESLKSNLKSNLKSPKSKKSTKTGPKDPPREGGDGSNEQNALLSEYLLLLKKGLLTAEEQGRFNSLKSRLGKAEGGIMNVNMNRGQLGETLYG